MSNIQLHTEEKELEVLKYIYANAENIHQRDLAKIIGLSLGMTNVILKRLAQKGFLKIRKVNNRNIKYIVSAKGIEAISRRSYQFFKSTIKSVVSYKETIETLIKDVRKEGFSGVLLIGRSDLDFIIEHVCIKYGILYVKEPTCFDGKLFSIYSESYLIDEETEEAYSDRHVEFLQRVLMD